VKTFLAFWPVRLSPAARLAVNPREIEITDGMICAYQIEVRVLFKNGIPARRDCTTSNYDLKVWPARRDGPGGRSSIRRITITPFEPYCNSHNLAKPSDGAWEM
jgi:hypothetical protein